MSTSHAIRSSSAHGSRRFIICDDNPKLMQRFIMSELQESVEQMMEKDKGELTVLIERAAAGDREAEKQFWTLVYGELRQRARRQIGGGGDGTMQSAELVGSLFGWARRTGELRKVANRKEFYDRAALKMQCLLLDYYRKRNRESRRYIPLDEAVVQWCEATTEDFETKNGFSVKEFNNALRCLRRNHRRQYDIMRMHIWLGMTQGEIAEALGVGKSLVERDYRFARAKLYEELRKRRKIG